MAILGIGAVALGVEAQPEQAKQTVTIVLRPDGEVFRKAITDAVIGDIRAGGKCGRWPSTMRILGEKVDNLAFFVVLAVMAVLMWLPSKLPIDGESKAMLAAMVVFVCAPVILLVMLTRRER